MVHGIPDSRPLEEGDVVTIDVTVFLNGFHGDCAETFAVGSVSKESQDLMAAAKGALCIHESESVKSFGLQVCFTTPFPSSNLALCSVWLQILSSMYGGLILVPRFVYNPTHM